jgi:DNA-binding NarL/FixJ family response regulator
VDDHALVRRGFRRLLDDDPTIEVVGEAGNGEAAIELIGRLAPRVVVMDCAMPGMGGLAAARMITQRWPDIAVLMLSMHNQSQFARQAIEAGARGYVLKETVDLDLAASVRQVASGAIVVGPELSAEQLGKHARAHHLSPRQLEVLKLICGGFSNPDMAALLGLSINTIAVHRAAIMRALGVHRTSELVAYALKHKLVNPP